MSRLLLWLELNRPHGMLKFWIWGIEPWAVRPAMKVAPDGSRWTPLGAWFWLRLDERSKDV